MVALFVVPAFCTKSGYIYKNKGGGGATKSEPNQKQTAIVKCKESDTGANYTFRIINILGVQKMVIWSLVGQMGQS